VWEEKHRGAGRNSHRRMGLGWAVEPAHEKRESPIEEWVVVLGKASNSTCRGLFLVFPFYQPT